MATAGEEIRVEHFHVERDVAGAVGRVDEGEDVVLFTGGDEALEGKAHGRKGDDGVEDGQFYGTGFGRDGGLKGGEEVIVGDRELDFYAKCFGGCGLDDVSDGVSAGAVDEIEIQDFVTGGPLETAEDCVDACSDIGDEYDRFGGRVDELGNGNTGFVQKSWEVATDVGVRTPLGEALEVVVDAGNRFGTSAEGTYGRVSVK